MRTAFILLFLNALLSFSPRRRTTSSNGGIGIGMADANMIQDGPLRVNRHVTVVGTSYVSANKYSDAVISIPEATKPGDMLVIYIGGSHAGNLIPSSPIPRAGWEEIIDIGPSDLNLKAFYKPYESYGDDDTYKVTDGKSTFVSIVAIRGLNKRRPVVDSGADKDVVSGREGGARAPNVQTEDDGVILASYVYDDPQVARIMGRHDFDMILSTDTRSGDGMSIGVKSTTAGESGYIYAEGQWQPGGGNEIGMAISFRSVGGNGNGNGDKAKEDKEEEEAVRSDFAAEYYSGSSAPPDEEDTNIEVEQTVVETPRPTKRSTKRPTRSPTTRRPSTSSPTASPSKSPETQNPTYSPTRRPSPLPTEDVVDLLPKETIQMGPDNSGNHSDDGTDSYDGPQYEQPNETSSLNQQQQPVPSDSSDDNTPLLIGVMVGLLIFSTVVIGAAIKYRRDVMQGTQSKEPTKQTEDASSKRGPPVRSDTYLSDTSESDEEYGPPRSESWLSYHSDVDSDLSAIEEGGVVCNPLPRSSSNASSTLSVDERNGFAQFIQPSTSFPPPPPPPL